MKIYAGVSYKTITSHFEMQDTSRTEKGKHKLSKSFIFAEQHRQKPSPQKSQTKSSSSAHRIRTEVLNIQHQSSQLQNLAKIQLLTDQEFKHKYLKNPFFKQKVETLYKKYKQRNKYKVVALEDESRGIHVEGFVIRQFTSYKEQMTAKERQEQQMVQKYERLILEMMMEQKIQEEVKPYQRKEFVSDQRRRDEWAIGGEFTYNQYMQQQSELDARNELMRSAMRIQQSREEGIDYFVKVVCIYKSLLPIDGRSLEIMREPKKYLQALPFRQLEAMIGIGERFRQAESSTPYAGFWDNVLTLIQSCMQQKKKNQSFQLKPEYEQQVRQILNKPLEKLLVIRDTIQILLQNPSFSIDTSYWEYILAKIKVKEAQDMLFKYYEKFRRECKDLEEVQIMEKEVEEEPTSPMLTSLVGINPKLIITEEDDVLFRKELGEKIFREQFEKGKEKLENNLHLPQNHSLLSTEIISEQTNTYDQITKEIIEFEKYKRMEQDEEDFNDWVPTETEGRYRDRKPYYINRVRVSCEWNKYNQTRYNEDNPPPKTIQGYKFNIFYPDLLDKQKTPQYYLQSMDNPDYCVIKFKAGPPYKDIAFKILRKEWDFTQRSGYESIFAKGILHLYFNFKKPRFRI